MDAAHLRRRVQGVLDAFLEEQRAVLAAVSVDTLPLLDAVQDLLVGGKRLRPAFCFWGWRGAGGPDPVAADVAVRVAASLELFQAAALLHDDVMDRSDTRRGRPAMHRAFAARHRERGWLGDPEQFGDGAAVLAGDLCLSWNDELLSRALREHLADGGHGLPGAPARVEATRREFDRMRTELMAGQYLDVLAQSGGSSGDDPVAVAREVIRFKSAKYTIEHPLLVGAALAGASPALRAAYSAYGLALGEAFQLRDDVLGVFGDPEATGKPAGDDLREGKRTVLVALASRAADARGRSLLEEHLGRRDLDEDGVQRVRDVLRGSGALEETERMIASQVAAARRALDGAQVAEPARTVLLDLVGTATERTA
ncbi:polyprenyl synthetase family protein [Thalassiella azotivora]